jgi:hypothetical protein
MMTTKVLSMVIGTSLALAAPVAAQTMAPVAAQTMADERWSVTFGAGAAPSVGGVYHEGGAGTVLNLPTQVQERAWSDIFGGGFAMRLGVAYALSPAVDVTGSFLYSRQDAEELLVGDVAGLALRAQFSEYRDRGVEAGVRWNAARDRLVNPYIGAAAGVRWIDAMPATFSVPDAGVVLPDVPFHASSTVPTFGGDFGVDFAVAPRLRFGVEARLRWTGDLAELDGLAGTGLENLNASSSRWTMPVLGTVSVRF